MKSEHSPTYVIDGRLRKVEPYEHVFESHCKGRWLGMEILGVFMKEFRDRSYAYYVCVEGLAY